MFSNLKVVELASVLAGPAVGMFFAELGAQVIKIENAKTGGDVTRNWRISDEQHKLSAYYCSVNWNKETWLLDLTTAAAQAELLAIIKDADVVIANYKPGDAEKLGLDYAAIQQINPNIIYASLKGFNNSPERVAYDVVLQAETGFMYMNGTPDSGPIKMPVALIDVLAAHQLKEAILIALLKKAKTGLGSFVETSLEEAAIASLANQATNWLMNQHNPQPMGSLHPNIAPYGEIFETADGVQFVLAVGAENQFKQLAALMELPELADDERFSKNQARVENRTELAKILAVAFGRYDFEALSIQLSKLKIPFGKINSVKEVLETETAQNMILKETVDGQVTQRVKTVAFNRFW